MKTLDQAYDALIEIRNHALTEYGNHLLEQGYQIDDPAFRGAMLLYGGELEEWRHATFAEIVRMANDEPKETFH